MEQTNVSAKTKEKVFAELLARMEAMKKPVNMKTYPDGELVALEQKQCLVCGKLYETGNLLMDRGLRKVFENRYACTGWGLCPEHQKYVDDGYIICIEVANKPANDGEVLKPEDADRTGNCCYMKMEAGREIFNMQIDSPVVFFEVGVIEKLKGIFMDAVREEDSESAV